MNIVYVDTLNKLALTLPGGQTIYTPQTKFTNLGEFLSGLSQIVFLMATFLALYWLSWGVFEYLFAGGDKQKLAAARNRIMWAIIGLIVLLLAFLIAQFVAQIVLPAGSNQPANTLPIFGGK